MHNLTLARSSLAVAAACPAAALQREPRCKQAPSAKHRNAYERQRTNHEHLNRSIANALTRGSLIILNRLRFVGSTHCRLRFGRRRRRSVRTLIISRCISILNESFLSESTVAVPDVHHRVVLAHRRWRFQLFKHACARCTRPSKTSAFECRLHSRRLMHRYQRHNSFYV